VVDALCEAIEVGANYGDAAAYAGICSATLSLWRDRGEEIAERIRQSDDPTELTPDDKLYLDFWVRFSEAEAAGAVNCATVIYNSAMKDPVWAEKWLRRRRPAEWGGNNEIDAASGAAVIVRVAGLDGV
jgi:hypothetical protein